MLWGHQWLSGAQSDAEKGRAGSCLGPMFFSLFLVLAAGLGVPAMVGRDAVMRGHLCQ